MKKLFFNIKQRDAMDCGPSCLAMIARYYGLRPERDGLRRSCSLGKDGVSLLGISKAAETIGFKTIGGRVSFDTLAFEVPLPCIVHWNQNHFVVVYKIKKRRGNRYEVYVADPGKGLITYTKEVLCSKRRENCPHSKPSDIPLGLSQKIQAFLYATHSRSVAWLAPATCISIPHTSHR